MNLVGERRYEHRAWLSHPGNPRAPHISAQCGCCKIVGFNSCNAYVVKQCQSCQPALPIHHTTPTQPTAAGREYHLYLPMRYATSCNNIYMILRGINMRRPSSGGCNALLFLSDPLLESGLWTDRELHQAEHKSVLLPTH